MADSRAVDAAQRAGFSVTNGVVTQELEGGALERLRRVIGPVGGKLVYRNALTDASKVFFTGVAGKEFTVTALPIAGTLATYDTDPDQGADAALVFTATALAGYGVAPVLKVAYANTASDGHSDVTVSTALAAGILTVTVGIKTTVTLASEVKAALDADPTAGQFMTWAYKTGNDGSGAVATMAAKTLAGGVAPTGTANAKATPVTVALVVPVDDNQAHALDVTVSGKAITVSLQVDTDGSTILSTAADVVAAINADVEANLLVSAALSGNTPEAKAKCTFEDIAQSGDDLIFTAKNNGVKFAVVIREPRGRMESNLTAVTVSVDNANIIEIIVPATKTVANVKTAVEGHTAANALVAVTTAGTTTHAIAVTGRSETQAGSFANRGSALMTALAAQTLVGGVAADYTLEVDPATS